MKTKIVQLYIFPYAGGSIAAFKRLTDLIDERIDVVTVEYPGRSTRVKEPLAESMDLLLSDAISYCSERRDPSIPYAVMGYSMGSVLAYEMLVRHPLEGDLQHLFVCAEISPKDRSLELSRTGEPTDERILERARRLGGLDERMISNRRFADIYLKPMISDYRLLFGYRFPGYQNKIKVDTTAIYCEQDTALKEVEKWDELIDGKFEFHEMGENHFFINQHYKDMARVINETLL